MARRAQAVEVKYGPYNAQKLTVLGHKYRQLDEEIKALTAEKKELNETFKLVLPVGANTVVGDIIFSLENKTRTNVDNKVLRKLVEEAVGLQKAAHIWATCSFEQSVPTLSIKRVG